jgi:hypothetical protein
MKTGKISAICIFLVFMGSVSVFGMEVKGYAPKFTATGLPSAVIDTLNDEIDSIFGQAKIEIEKQIEGIDEKPEKFIQAWGNSSVFASHGATQRAYGGYKVFAFTVGPMVGVQLPSSPFTIADEFADITDKLNKERDLNAGLNPQLLTGQIGINMSKFLMDKLYLGLRFGYMNLDSLDLIDGFSFNTTSFGIMANYQLIPQKKLVDFLLWRGVNLGTGFIYQGTNIGYTIKMDPTGVYSAAVPSELSLAGVTGMDLIIEPSLSLDVDIKTFTVPLEISTSVRLLWFLNFALGAGVDLGYGTSDMKASMSGDVIIDVKGNASTVTQTPGNVSVSAGGDMSPSFFNPKLMTGVGITLGPVVIDIPVTWYFANEGYNVGVTVGIVW